MIIPFKTISYDTRVRTFWTLTLIGVVSLALYVYGVLATVHHTVARQALQAQVSELTTQVSELEFKAIALKNEVNLNLAMSRGFKEVTDPLFISRSAAKSLSFNTPGR
ncbi:hypothetical protein KW785_01780 [Candidatus Parcubacteria bacterium]|nr:hypothetical protein [Candidatus Parcubacteria bacterium]